MRCAFASIQEKVFAEAKLQMDKEIDSKHIAKSAVELRINSRALE
jgi:hypothetical protein